MKHQLTQRFSDEVDKQIAQFAIDLIEAVSNETDSELDKRQGVLGLNREQVAAFRAIQETAHQAVLARYELQTSDTRTDKPYQGEGHTYEEK
jgi:hypothetical protein